MISSILMGLHSMPCWSDCFLNLACCCLWRQTDASCYCLRFDHRISSVGFYCFHCNCHDVLHIFAIDDFGFCADPFYHASEAVVPLAIITNPRLQGYGKPRESKYYEGMSSHGTGIVIGKNSYLHTCCYILMRLHSIFGHGNTNILCELPCWNNYFVSGLHYIMWGVDAYDSMIDRVWECSGIVSITIGMTFFT